jgi:hypothetical protein
MDIDDLGHGFCLASGFITNGEQLKQVAEIGLESVLLDDLREVDKIPELRFTIGQLASTSKGSKRWLTSWGWTAPPPASSRTAPLRRESTKNEDVTPITVRTVLLGGGAQGHLLPDFPRLRARGGDHRHLPTGRQ